MSDPEQSLGSHSYHGPKSSSLAAQSPLRAPLSTSTYRKRSVRASLVDRMKVFEANQQVSPESDEQDFIPLHNNSGITMPDPDVSESGSVSHDNIREYIPTTPRNSFGASSGHRLSSGGARRGRKKTLAEGGSGISYPFVPAEDSLGRHSYHGSKPSVLASASPLRTPLSTSTYRKRSVRSSLVDRMKVFDTSNHSSAEASVRDLLSPKEVKDLIRHNNHNNKRLSDIVHRYEHLSETQQRERLKDKESSKSRQRQGIGSAASLLRRQQWEAAKGKFANAISGTTTNEFAYQQVRAAQYTFEEGFEPPQYPKTENQERLILEAIERVFCFSEFRKRGGKARTDESWRALVAAFEIVPVSIGQVLLQEGNMEGNDKFTIIEFGSLEFHADGISVATLSAGQSFGEQALLYQAPSTTTVSVSRSSEMQGTEDGQILTLDQRTFRGIVHKYTQKAAEEKRKRIMSVDFLENLLQNDTDLQTNLVATMTRLELDYDEDIEAIEDNTFFIVDRGQIDVTKASGAKIATLNDGDYFGERALIGSLPRKSMVETQTTMKTSSKSGCVLFKIDRVQMESILGPSRLQNLKDMRRLAASKFFKDAKLSAKKTNKLASTLVEQKLEANGENSTLQISEDEVPALYVVREGTVLVSYDDANGVNQERELTVGDVFGHEQLEGTNINGEKTLKRVGGLKAVVASGDKMASIATLTLANLELQESRHSQSDSSIQDPIPQNTLQRKNRPLTRENAANQLRQKVRDAVQSGVTLEDLEKTSLLGAGEFGEVWLVAADVFKSGEKGHKHEFAFKSQFKVDETRGKDALDSIRREIDVMRDLEHPQIVDLVNTYEDDESVYALMSLIPGGEIWDQIHKEDESGNWTSGLSEDPAKFYTMVIADTLGFMHSKGYIFRDLKPENIMIDRDGYPVFVDFGFAKYCPDKTWTFCGTPNYVAPEIITNSGHDRGVDFWALGITLYEIITGENPFFFEGMDQVTLYDAICTEKYYALSEERSPELVDLVDKLLEKDPAKRLGKLAGGIDDILGHPWFEGLDLMRLRAKRLPSPWKPDTVGTYEDNMILDMISLHDSHMSLNDSVGSFGSFSTIPAILEEGFDEEDKMDTTEDPSETEVSTLSLHENPSAPVSSPSLEQEEKPETVDVSEPPKSLPPTIEKKSHDTAKKEKKKKKKDKKAKKSKNTSNNNEMLSPSKKDASFGISNPKRRVSRQEAHESKERRSAISGALAGLGLDDDDDFELNFLKKK